MLALIATLPMGGAAIAAGSAVFAGTCIVGLLLAPRPPRLAVATAAVSAPVGRVVDRAIDVAEAPARVLSLVAFVAIVWFIPIRVYTLPAPGPVKLEPYRLMVLLLAVALRARCNRRARARSAPAASAARCSSSAPRP